MTTITDKKQYPGEQYLNELITNIELLQGHQLKS